jgi:integrase
MKFTEATVKAFAIPSGKDDHYEWDDSMPGFGFRCRNVGGSKVYLVKYRVGEKQRKLTLGATNKVSLEAARTNAKALFAKVAMRIDPANERAVAVAGATQTFDPIINGYIAMLKDAVETGARTQKHYLTTMRFLKNYFKPLHGLALASIERHHVATQLNVIRLEHGPVAMNRARGGLSSFFNWAIGEGICKYNPVDKTNKSEEQSRERVLENAELKTIWRSLPDNDYGKINKLLILTAQRRGEIGEMRVAEFNRAERQIELPPERTKNGLPHIVPLSDAALAILESIDMEGRTYVFGRNLSAPFSGYSKAKTELDLECKIEKPWVLHDYRRTGSTRMGDEGVFPHVVEAVLNHISGNKAGVAGTYNKAMYLKEKREALNTLASFIDKAVS